MVDMKQIELEQEIMAYDGEDRVLPADEVLKRYIADRPKGEKILSKIPTLDKTIGGFYPGQLITVSGVTGSGKTSLCQTFTKNMSEQLTAPLWFTYEVPVDDFLSIFHSDYLQHIYMPLQLKDNSLKWIEDRIFESRVKYSTTVCFIDHIHFLVSMNPKQNMSFTIGETVRGLKKLALKYNMIVFLIAHMMKTRPEDEPSLGMIRDSSFIEQESDTVLYTWRKPKDQWVTMLKVAKNRKRGLVDVKIPLMMKDRQFFETTEDES